MRFLVFSLCGPLGTTRAQSTLRRAQVLRHCAYSAILVAERDSVRVALTDRVFLVDVKLL